MWQDEYEQLNALLERTVRCKSARVTVRQNQVRRAILRRFLKTARKESTIRPDFRTMYLRKKHAVDNDECVSTPDTLLAIRKVIDGSHSPKLGM